MNSSARVSFTLAGEEPEQNSLYENSKRGERIQHGRQRGMARVEVRQMYGDRPDAAFYHIRRVLVSDLDFWRSLGQAVKSDVC